MRNQRGNCGPILATVRILQLLIFVYCPFTPTSIRSADDGIQDLLPSVITLTSRSTRDQSGNCRPILATAPLYRILQLDVFVF
jgi:hypothetical protein